jgi:hypothetical protein
MSSGFEQLERELRAAAARQHVGRQASKGLAFGGLVPGIGALLAVLIAVGAISLLHKSPHVPLVSGSRAVLYTDPAGWTLTYPGGMHLERSGIRSFVSEVTIASFVPSLGVVSWHSGSSGGFRLFPPVDREGRFPSDAIAFRLLDENGLIPPSPSPHSGSRFPIRMASFRPSQRTPGLRFNAGTGETPVGSAYGGAPPSLVRDVVVGRNFYTLIVWIGRSAPPRLRAGLANMISSLSFPPAASSPFPN